MVLRKRESRSLPGLLRGSPTGGPFFYNCTQYNESRCVILSVMNKEERVKYWLDIAEYDIDTAEAM